MHKHLQLNIGAPARLAALRAANPANWREARSATLLNFRAYCGEGLDQGFDGTGRNRVAIWYTFTEDYFRYERDAHEIADAGIRHTGWYCDEHGDSLCVGIIARLPHGRFIAGYRQDNGGMRTWHSEVFDSAREAARMADEHARVIGEAEREHDIRWNAARALEAKVERKLQRLRECLSLRHNPCFKYAREEIAECIAAIRNARDELATDYKDVAE